MRRVRGTTLWLAVLAGSLAGGACGDRASAESDTAPPNAREDSLAGLVTQLESEVAALRGEARRLRARVEAAERAPGGDAPRDDAAPTAPEAAPAPAPRAASLDAAIERVLLRFPGSNGAQITYVGEARGGQAHGVGYAVWSTGSSYEGEWRANQRHGEGRHRYPDGARYEGTYVDDAREGQGTYHYRNGQRWEGPWQANLRHGEGVLYEANGRVRVRGIWERDRLVREIKD
jgi:outer membrane murein-binding lipoprotein Lpp